MFTACRFTMQVKTKNVLPFQKFAYQSDSDLSALPRLPPGSLYLHKGLFCVEAAPPLTGRWSGTGLPFSQGHFLTALCSSPAFNNPIIEPLFFHPPPACRSAVHLVCTPAARCSEDTVQSAACVRSGLLGSFYNVCADVANLRALF